MRSFITIFAFLSCFSIFIVGKHVENHRIKHGDKRDCRQSTDENNVCLAEIPGFDETAYTNVTWWLMYSTEECNQKCVTTMAKSTGSILSVYTFKGRCSDPVLNEYNRVGKSNIYKYPSQSGDRCGEYAVRSIAEIGESYYVDYTSDSGEEMIEVYVTNPLAIPPGVLTGCGAGRKLFDCEPDATCLATVKPTV